MEALFIGWFIITLTYTILGLMNIIQAQHEKLYGFLVCVGICYLVAKLIM